MTNLPAIQSEKFTAAQIELIRNTVAKGATDDELKLFLYQCDRLGLDALSKQIHFVKYGSGPGTTIVGIDGFRIVAHRSGKLSGIKRGATRDDNGKLVGGWAEVYRTDWTHPAREEVPLEEYYKPGKNGYPSNWDKMPETMIKKVAEAAALRMAFPQDLSGIYSEDEMDQANGGRDVAPKESQPTRHSTSEAPLIGKSAPNSTNDQDTSTNGMTSPTTKSQSTSIDSEKEYAKTKAATKPPQSVEDLRMDIRAQLSRLNWTIPIFSDYTDTTFGQAPQNLTVTELNAALGYLKTLKDEGHSYEEQN